MIGKNNPAVAIIVLNWNGLTDTLECLNSLKEIDYPNYKVVVVDNASSDGSPEVIKVNFAEHMLLSNSENLGFPEGNNVGIRWALKDNYEYVLLLNNDTTVKGDFLSKLMDVCNSESKCGIVGPNILYHGEPTKSWSLGGYFGSRNGRPYQYNSFSVFNGNPSLIREVGWVSGCALLIKSEAIKKAGLLDPDYFFGSEDADWCARVKKTGYKILYVHDSVVFHKKPMQQLRKDFTPSELYYTMRNILIFALKNDLFSFSFILSFIISFTKRMMWVILTLNFNGISALFRAVIDFKRRRFGRARYSFD